MAKILSVMLFNVLGLLLLQGKRGLLGILLGIFSISNPGKYVRKAFFFGSFFFF